MSRQVKETKAGTSGPALFDYIWILLTFSMKNICLLPILLLSLSAKTQEKRLILQHVRIVDVEKGRIIQDQAVAITDDRITAIVKASAFKRNTGDSIVDCKGRYLIPGLWDMHTHVWAADYFFSIFIGNGVTGIRGMFEQPVSAKNWQQRGNTPGDLAPRGYYAGPIVDGPKPIWPGSVAVTDAGRGRKVVDSLKNQVKVDFIKVYSLLERDAYFAIADEARKQGIVFAGHVPNKVTVLEAARAGQRSMEHLYGFIELASDSSDYYYGLVKGTIKDSAYASRNARRELLRRTFSEKKLVAIINELKQYDTWICPTMTVNRGIAYINDSAFRKDDRMVYVPPMIKNMWDPKNDFRFRTATPEFFKGEQLEYAMKKMIVRALHQAGIKLLAGTDTPNPFCFPGFSLHDELEIFTECGLSTLEALQTATLNPARYFGRENDLGTVALGKLADLVLLEAHPLEDINNTRQVGAVVLKGRFLGSETVSGLWEKARKIAGN